MNKKVGLAVVLAVLVLAAVIAVAIVYSRSDDDNEDVKSGKKVGEYQKFAVAADRKVCSNIGSNILKDGGSAVDAAVATVFCVGLLNMHSCGIGGGGFMNVYLRKEKKSIIYDFRETAPAAATQKMFIPKNASSVIGGLAIAVPGNIKGLHHVWKKHGTKPWKDLVQPTIDMAKKGFIISPFVGKRINDLKDTLGKNKGFSDFLKKKDGTWYKTGDKLTNPLLADTLERISNDPNTFYNGTLAQEIVDDITEAGGIITLQDLKYFKVIERESLNVTIEDKEYLFMPPPGGGAVVAMTMNILKGYNFTLDDFKNEKKVVSTTHKIIEALKFAFARRPLLADPSFSKNVSKVINDMIDLKIGQELRQKIMEKPYPNQTYYGGFYQQTKDQGTTHVSILAENGDAVSVTDTINYAFGSAVRSTRNGIIYNNEMDDFSTPGLVNLWGYLPAEANFIEPGKKPLSSMSPTIVTDQNGDVKMVVGGSGGSRIITGVLQTLVRKLYFNMDLDEAVDTPRVHTHLLPYEVYVYNKFKIPETLKKGLQDLGHKLVYSDHRCVVQAIYRKEINGTIYAVSDPRKGGVPAGM